MILNSYIVTYLVCSALSVIVGLTAALSGFHIWKKWDIKSQADEQYSLEKKVYLIITIMSLGFFLRLLMVPLWFWTLQSMIVSIPGAMCLVGVHNINAPFSYIASGLKLILPALYGYWLILNILDRQVVTQPFMKQKLMFLTPLGGFIMAETILDISFFFSTPPRQVSCCTSLFDIPREDILHIVTESTWVWVVFFYILALVILGEVVYFIIAQKRSVLPGRGRWFGKKSVMLSETIGIAVTLVVFIFALHTRISPLFLGLPFHHCVFCLGQEVRDALVSFSMVFIGLILLLIYFWVVSSTRYREVNLVLSGNMVILLKFSGTMLSLGLIILSIHLVLAL
ncbi:MAG: hypothetical protein SWO11_12510 [Thermodesulfobacteriota bacterium]|nr:hypothetical protein [Thermodesulfobacteriota bacterium]